MTTMNRSANINELLKEKERPHVVGKKEKLTEGNKHVVIVNFGYKKTPHTTVLRSSVKGDNCSCSIIRPDVHTLTPDGVIFSGGPGNPEDWKIVFSNIQRNSSQLSNDWCRSRPSNIGDVLWCAIEKMKIGHRSFKATDRLSCD